MFETPNKPKNLFFRFVKQNGKNRNRFSFGSFQFIQKIFLFVSRTLYIVVSENAWLRRTVQSQADFNRSTLQSRKKDTAHRKIIYQTMKALTDEHVTTEQSLFVTDEKEVRSKMELRRE